MTQSTHENCTAHSGLEGKLTLIIWLLGLCFSGMLFLIGLNVKTYIAINDNLSGIDNRVTANTVKISEIDRRLDNMERRQ